MASQVFATNSLGGYLYADNLSEELRMGLLPMWQFRQFADAREAAGLHKGQNFHWDVVSTVARGNRALQETNTMPQGNVTITQGTLTIDERGFSIPWTGKLESLAKFSVRAPMMKALRADSNRDLDALCSVEFNKTPLRYSVVGSSAGTLTSNSTAASTNSVAFQTIHWKDIVDKMRERNIKFYTKREYVAIGWPAAWRAVKNQLETIHQYTETGLELIFNGEIGRYEMTRAIEQTNVPKGGAADSTTYSALEDTADAWDNALADWIYFFGEDTVTEGIAIDTEIRAKDGRDDYGRSKGIAWYSLLGFGIVHNQSGATSQSRIVKWDSAS